MQLPTAVQSFLHGLRTGDWDGIEARFTPDARYDATVPGSRYGYVGAQRIARELREEWTARNTWEIVELHTAIAEQGSVVVVDLEVHGRRAPGAHWPSGEVCCRLANLFRLENGRIAEHRFYCCGEWDASLMHPAPTHAPTAPPAPA